MYLDKNIPAPSLGDWEDREDANRDGMMADCKWGIIPEAALHRARCAYYGLITHIDHQIGRMIQAFGEYGLLESTIFLFTSDHGDMLGDHNFFRKALPYEGSAGIPLVIWDPGDLLGLERGSTSHALAELRDIMPTILSMAGADIPETVDGKNLLSGSPREYLHGEHELGPCSNHFIVTNHDKYIWYSQDGREQYFDLTTDPEELHNGIGDEIYQQRIACLRSLLIQALKGREEGYTDGNTLLPGRPPKDTLENRRK